jgi:hypothetical protein
MSSAMAAGTAGDAALSAIGDASENNIRQLDHNPPKPGVFFKQRDNAFRMFLVGEFFIMMQRFIEAALLLEKFPFAIRWICGSHD